jgi:hypothetical protein
MKSAAAGSRWAYYNMSLASDSVHVSDKNYARKG